MTKAGAAAPGELPGEQKPTTPPSLVKGSRAASSRSYRVMSLFLSALTVLSALTDSWLFMHSTPPARQPMFMVRSLQLVEVRLYIEEEDHQSLR